MRGILMIEDLVWQTVDGYKTQTRRTGGLESVNIGKDEEDNDIEISDLFELVRYNDTHAKFTGKHDSLNEMYCYPRYKIDEVLYIKEPILSAVYKGWLRVGGTVNIGSTRYYYDLRANDRDGELKQLGITKSNKLYMKAADARFFIRITGIKCERLLSISEADCEAEGIEKGCCFFDGEWGNIFGWRDYAVFPVKADTDPYDIYGFPPTNKRSSFFSLFRFANKITAKKDIGNPWVWAYEYEYLKEYKLAE